MNWFDYLRGYEEGHYEGRVYGRGSGLLGALLQLLFMLILIVISFTWLVCKGILMLVWKPIKFLFRRHNKF
ncbi:MAG TPA: hypothetical protein VFS36_00525 [Chitinophagaceae bacterium]|jgi:hypothetical protein|nr:hypothetical protein [Chitinophagaceae bacterium]